MFTYNLRENRKKDVAIYAPAFSFRFICIVFAAFLVTGLVMVLLESGWENSYICPVLIIIALVLSALYRDEWVMDNNRQVFSSVFGIGPFVKVQEYSYEDIRRLEVVHFIKGLPDDTKEKPSWKHRAYIVFRIKLNGEEEEVHQLEIMPEKSSGGKLERIANLIAAYTGLELYIDRPRDESVNLKRVF